MSWNLWCPKSTYSYGGIQTNEYSKKKKTCFEFHVLCLLVFMFHLALMYLENTLNWEEPIEPHASEWQQNLICDKIYISVA